MEFQIAVRDFKEVYSPGDKIEGTVVLNGRSDIAASAIRINFKGKSKVEFKEGQREYSSKAVLFHYTQSLYSGRYTFSAAKQFEWPFEFTFPTTPQRPREDSVFKKKGSWTYDSNWTLPPSLALHNESATSEVTCDVEYKLDAELMKPETSFSFNSRRFRARKLLKFSPGRDEPNPSTGFAFGKHPWHVQSLRILPDFQGRSLTMKEKMHSVFSSNLPLSALQVSTILPKQVVQDTVFPIHVKVEHLPANSTTDTVPAVRLRELSVSVRILTTARADGDFGIWHTFDDDKKYVIIDRRNVDLPLLDENTPLEPDANPLDLGELFNVKCKLPMNFLSYNIRRNYILRLRVVLQCADKRRELRQIVSGFRILSRSYLGHGGSPCANDAGDDPGINDAPVLPSYSWPSDPSFDPGPAQPAPALPAPPQMINSAMSGPIEPPPAYQP